MTQTPSLRVALVDSGGTNIGSVANAVERLGATAALTSNPRDILAADRVILPGVGAAGAGMAKLHDLGLVDVLHQVQAPMLGVCLGMQLLFQRSEEDGGVDLLGFIPAEVTLLPSAEGLRVPHMGWNTLELLVADPLTAAIASGERAYFVHSYCAPVGEWTLAAATHGQRFSAVVRRGNVWGAQFHPEKSSTVGARLLANFLSPAVEEASR